MSFSAVPATATFPFQFNCTFIAGVTGSLFLFIYFIKMAFLACNTGVCVCVWVKMSQASLWHNYNKRNVSGPREWMKYVFNGSRLWEWLSSLPDSQHPPWPLRHHRWHPGTGQPPVRRQWTLKSSDFLFSLGFSLIGTYLMFQARSANHGQMFERVSSSPLQTEICSEIIMAVKIIWDINMVVIFCNESVIIAFP